MPTQNPDLPLVAPVALDLNFLVWTITQSFSYLYGPLYQPHGVDITQQQGGLGR